MAHLKSVAKSGRRALRGASHREKALPQLDDWRLVDRVGEGSLAVVYSACHASCRTSMPATYAIKLLRDHWQGQEQVVGLLRREAVVGKQVNHPSVVQVLDASLSSAPYFVVMPLLEGATLDCHLQPNASLPVATALWIVRQCAEALQAIHTSCGMTHGDVKPANIHLSPQGHVTLLDLSFARLANEHRCGLDRPELGSLAYAAPETLTSTFAADVRSDSFSLGVVFYEMLIGAAPFAADEAHSLSERIRGVKPTCIRKLRPDVPRGVAGLVHAMLSKEPLRRPQSYDELIGRLLALEVECFALR